MGKTKNKSGNGNKSPKSKSKSNKSQKVNAKRAIDSFAGQLAGIGAIAFADHNSYRYWLIIALNGFLTHYFITHSFTPLWWIVTIILSGLSSIVTDFFYYYYGIQFYDAHVTIVRGYSCSAFFNDTLHSVGLDYGFNFYNGNYDKPRSQAQIDKFVYAVKQLGIKEGDRVIDIGCGCGDWLYYLQNTMKCTVVGVNITDAQAQQARSRGLTIITSNWKDIKYNQKHCDSLYGQFDVVTFWDTVEHYVPFGVGIWKRHNREKIYQDMFTLAKNLTDKSSRLQTCWISCLHMRYEAMPPRFIQRILCPSDNATIERMKEELKNKPRGKFDTKKNYPVMSPWEPKQLLWKWYSIYLLDKFHSGFYPSYYFEKGKFYDELVDNGEAVGYDLTWREDTTLDYYMTSKLNPTHFGRHRFNFTPSRVLGLCLNAILDPYWVHRMLWYTVEAWMEQFDGDNMENSFVILWWLVFKLDRSNKSSKQGSNGVTRR